MWDLVAELSSREWARIVRGCQAESLLLLLLLLLLFFLLEPG